MVLLKEVWKPLPNFSKYLVSNLGNVRSLYKSEETLLKPYKAKKYLKVSLSESGVRTTLKVHRLVMLAFVGVVPSGMEVRHLDGNGSNNRLDNLKYGTKKENMSDSLLHGTHNMARKIVCPKGHPYSRENTRVRTDVRGSWRECKICSLERCRAYRLKYPEKISTYRSKHRAEKSA